MDLDVTRARSGSVTVTMTATPDEAHRLGPELQGLSESLRELLEVVDALRDDTEIPLEHWRDHLRTLRRLELWLEAPMRVAIRAHAAAGGSYGDLARALGVPRSTAQYQRDQLLAEPPHPSEAAVRRVPPRPAEADAEAGTPTTSHVVNYAAPGSSVGVQGTTITGVDI